MALLYTEIHPSLNYFAFKTLIQTLMHILRKCITIIMKLFSCERGMALRVEDYIIGSATTENYSVPWYAGTV